MIQTVCTLGRQPDLGLAELESLYGAGALHAVAPGVAGLDTSAGAVDFARLGGSTRLATVLMSVPGTSWPAVEKALQKLLRSSTFAIPAEGKFHLGLSAYGFVISPAKLTALGLTLKKLIRTRGASVRLVPNTAPQLSTAQVYHNHLSDAHGAELLIITASTNTLIARTIAVQDIDAYTLRDRGRPRRDARVGMLPPKLAQIIINLAAGHHNTDQALAATAHRPILLDPFCGTGVLLQEALLMSYNVYGTDLESRMVEYSRQNLAWLKTHYDVPDPQLETGDATTFQWRPQPALVACETYLGRPYTSLPDRPMLEQNVSDVNTILRKFLRSIRPQLAAGTRLCLAVPAWQLKPADFRHLPLIDQVADMGYNRIEFERVPGRSLLYYREDQTVARELLVLQVN